MLGDDVPVLVLLQGLKGSGWEERPAPPAHNMSTPKHFGTANYVMRRHYLQCLLSLASLVERGLVSLPSGQSPAYYKSVLTCQDLAALSAEPGTSSTRPRAAVQDGDSMDEDVVVRAPRGAPQLREALGQCAGGAVSAGRRGHLDRSLDVPQCPRQPRGVAAPGMPGRVSSSSSSSSSKGSGDDVDSDDVVAPAPVGHALPYLPSPYRITLDVRRSPGEPGHYRRLCIQCPASGTGHYHPGRLCKRYRNMGPAQCSRYGEREPELFLLAWADAHARFPDRAQHVAFQPTVADVGGALAKYGQGRDGDSSLLVRGQ